MPRILAYCLALIDNEEDRNKFEKLYYRYEKDMINYAKSLVRDRYLAEDIFSKTLEQIAKNMNSIGELEAPATKNYVLKAIKNHADNFSDREKNYRNHYISYETPDVESQVESASFEAANSPDDIRAEILADAIEKLSDKYRDVILLKYADGLSSKEISSLLGYTPDNVDQIVRRAKKELRKLVKDVKIE